MELISPELVLVDPELAERVRTLQLPVPWTAPAPSSAAPVASAAPAPPPATPPREDTIVQSVAARRIVRLAPGALIVGLLCLVILQLNRGSDVPASLSAPDATVTAATSTGPTAAASLAHPAPLSAFSPPARHRTTPARSSRPRSSAAHAQAAPRPGAPRKTRPRALTRTAAERAVLLLLQTLPRRMLPAGFVDPITKLVKTDVQARCRRTTSTRFRCVLVDPVTARRTALVYRPDRSGFAALSPAGGVPK